MGLEPKFLQWMEKHAAEGVATMCVEKKSPGGGAADTGRMDEAIQSHSGNTVKSHGKKLNRRKAIRARCLDCSGFSKKEVRACPIKDCPLYPFRIGKEQQDPDAREKAIRLYCHDCMNEQPAEVGLCPSGKCPLFPYRQTRPTMRKNKRIAEKQSDKSPAEGGR